MSVGGAVASVDSSTTSSDRRTMVAAQLLMRSQLKLVAQSICEKQQQEKGTGTSYTMIRYARMNVPVVALTEGVTPQNATLSVETVTGSLDQWGDVITITDVAQLTTLHPLVQIATELLGDNAQRVIDREIQIIMMAGTNVTYGDASVTSRAAVTTAMKISDTVLLRAKIVMGTNGAPVRQGPSNMNENAKAGPLSGNLLGTGNYVAVVGLEISADVQAIAASAGAWQNVNVYNGGGKAIYNGEVGQYFNFRFIETNFIPRFRKLGNNTATITAGADSMGITGLTFTLNATGGTFTAAAVYGIKITRKSKTRGFEEDISIIHTFTAGAGDNDSVTIVLPSTAGYLYQVYVDSVQAGGSVTDALLKLHTQNAEPGATVEILGVQATGAAPPPNTNPTGPVDSVYPMYILGAKCLMWTGLQQLQVITTSGADKSDPLDQRKTIGYKFMAKAAIMNQLFLMRVELASAFNI